MRREIHFPTGRFGEAVEQAQAVLFLASDESSFVNGTDFVVDGGMTRVCRTLLPEAIVYCPCADILSPLRPTSPLKVLPPKLLRALRLKSTR